MPDVKTCNICGQEYEGKKIGAIYQTITSRITIHDVDEDSYTVYDLCPSCVAKVKKHIKDLRGD